MMLSSRNGPAVPSAGGDSSLGFCGVVVTEKSQLHGDGSHRISSHAATADSSDITSMSDESLYGDPDGFTSINRSSCNVSCAVIRSPTRTPPGYGQIVRLQHVVLPVNRGSRKRNAAQTRDSRTLAPQQADFESVISLITAARSRAVAAVNSSLPLRSDHVVRSASD